MKKFLGMGKPSASMVVAVAALSVALAGGASAASGLITGGQIKDGSVSGSYIKNASVTVRDLAQSARAKLRSAERPAPVAPGLPGQAGVAGAPGRDGRDGVNPAVAIRKSGDGGWALSGTPAARLIGGELRLAGGFDASTVAGGIGMTKGYENTPLSRLSALSYSLHVITPPTDVSAPTIHVAVVGATTGTPTGFMNLVYEPVNNGGVDVGKPYALDAFTGEWWGTRDTPNHPRQATASLESFVQDNPDAKIVAISVDNGGTSGPGTIPVKDFAAGVDNLVVGIGSDFARYDFGG